ncbi:hypothetical protein [uncultured Kordia sp.]|uniref:hypothetical protein n=1 Tax=uncultured Kordia sp. TaxID=507699 RepID=UPI002602C884|nr:hypothetical protein [uncultured Kordia sp.]
MKKLNLKKSKIAAITNAYFINGGTDNSVINTICDYTNNESVTCHTNCDTCNTTNENSPCNSTNPGNTRPNKSINTQAAICLNNGG